MLGKLVGAFAGAEVAKHSTAIGGPAGAVIGALAVPLVRRLSLPTLVVLGAGGYFAKRYLDQRGAQATASQNPASRRTSRKATRKTATAPA